MRIPGIVTVDIYSKDDGLNAARGIWNAFVISAYFWGAIILATVSLT